MADSAPEPTLWKADWSLARAAFADWWAGTGLALHVTAPKDDPWEEFPAPPPPASLEQQWYDPAYRAAKNLHELSHTFFGGVAFPQSKVSIGPGSLGLMLGCQPGLAETTVWYEPVIEDPEAPFSMEFDRSRWGWTLHEALIRESLLHAPGRYLVGYPDLVENLDTLAQLRGSETTLMDLVERPDWVEERIAAINQAFFDAYDALWDLLRDPWGGAAFHAFSLWGPGKTAKIQCDFCCMISPRMFRRFVQPALAEQAAWLDYAMYHLDGTQALPQLDNLLSIEGIQAIEWTPQAGLPGGGSPDWYDLYRRIKAAGKSVQAIEVKPEEVEPLIAAVGPEGLFIHTAAPTEAAARDLLRRVGWPGEA